jgi:branched-chain amino acid transport system ATP-binding protein
MTATCHSTADSGQVRLNVRELSIRFGGVHAVSNVSLSLLAGEIHGLIGPNGAGKTSFIDGITGFYRPHSGRVSLDGREVTNCTPDQRVQLGMVRTFQNFELFEDLTLRENLSVARHAHGRERPRVEDVAAQVGIDESLPLSIESLSHGSRRMATVARALMSAPSVLILDEPGAGLTREEAELLSGVLRSLADDGMALLLVDHDMSLVLQASDRVTVMASGVELASGTPEAVRANEAVRTAYLGEI